MKLTDLIKEINNIDQEIIIFQSDMNNYNSDIILLYEEADDEGIKESEGIKYYYLIEVFLAKEFLEDWEASLNYKPSIEEKAKRLHEYSINDA